MSQSPWEGARWAEVSGVAGISPVHHPNPPNGSGRLRLVTPFAIKMPSETLIRKRSSAQIVQDNMLPTVHVRGEKGFVITGV